MTCVDQETGQPGTSDQILNREGIEFLCALQRYFSSSRRELLAQRDHRQQQFDMGRLPALQSEREPAGEPGRGMRRSPSGLTLGPLMLAGPPECGFFRRGMSSGAKVLIADFDDFLSPTWTNCLQGHAALRGALDPATAPWLRNLAQAPAAIFVRPRNWRHEEKHFLVDGTPMSASLFDFGLSIFNSVCSQSAHPAPLHFAISKLESRQEARLWSEIFCFAEQRLHLPHGSNHVIVTIDTVSAASDMDGILFELRERATALECSPVNYLSSFVRTFRSRGESLLPQRSDITLSQPFLHAYQELLIHTCHKRDVAAITSFPQQLGVRYGSEAEKARVSLAMKNAVELGFDGICVADPALAQTAFSAFEQNKRSQASNRRGTGYCHITFPDLMSPSLGQIPMTALNENVESTLIYLEGWLTGHGSAVLSAAINNMSSIELSRALLWQWLRYSARLTCGRRVNKYMIECVIRDTLASIETRMGGAEFLASKFLVAAELLASCCTDGYDSPLAQRAYGHLC